MTTKAAKAVTEAISVTAQARMELKRFAITPEISCFRLTYEIDMPDVVPAGMKEHFASLVKYGYAKPEAIEAYLAGTARVIEPIVGLFVVCPEFRESVAKVGLMKTVEKTNWLQVEDRFDDFVSGVITAGDLMRVDYGTHTVFDHEGSVLPIALVFDYSNGCIDESHYDLAKVVEVLAKDARVSPGYDLNRSKNYMDSICVQNIPYYNVSPGRSQTVAFIYSPTVEDIRKIWAHAHSSGRKVTGPTSLGIAALELDMLGLRSSGAERPEPLVVEAEDE